MTATSPVVTVGLLWHSFSSDNLGVGALSESQVAICEAAAARAGVGLCFVVFGTAGSLRYLPAGKHIREGSPISFKELLTGRSPFYREVADCDLVLDIGEGDSFTDIYGQRRFRVHIATKLAVLHKRIPLVLAPQTIGPFESLLARRLASFVMRRCAGVFARDGMSFEYLDRLGLGASAKEAIDVAFRLPFTPAPARSGGPLRVGLNVSGLLFAGGYEGQNQFGLRVDYAGHVRALLRHWGADPRIEVWLVAHVLSDDMPRDDDRRAIEQLKREFPDVRIAPAFTSPSEAKSFIAGLDFMTGARMHACIAAYSSGVPVVPLAYSRKFNGLFDSLDYRWVADGKALDEPAATSRVIDGFERRVELAGDIRRGLAIAADRLALYEDQLVRLLREGANQPGTGKSTSR